MKWLTYDEVGNLADYSRRPYEIDFDTAEERRYKEPMLGVRVYQHGVVSVRNWGHNNPDWRRDVLSKVGLEFVYPKELTGRKFVDPDTGKAVPKTALPSQLVYYDRERKRIYHVDSVCRLEFVSKDAQPSCGVFTYTFTNEERYAARMKELRKHIQMGEAFLALDGAGSSRHMFYSLRWTVESGGVPAEGDPSYKSECRKLASNLSAVKQVVAKATRDTRHPQYLTVMEV